MKRPGYTVSAFGGLLTGIGVLVVIVGVVRLLILAHSAILYGVIAFCAICFAAGVIAAIREDRAKHKP